MGIKKIKRAYHIKYGEGYVISDLEGTCKHGEVLFMPDDGIYDKTDIGSGKYAHFIPAKYDIFKETEIIELWN